VFDYGDGMVPQRDPDARERLAGLAPRISSGPLAGERSLPVVPVLAELLPTGLTRGSTVACSGRAAMSSAFLVAAGASQAGMWVGVAGVAALGVQACREAGVALERLVAVREPGSAATPAARDELWGQVLGALVDGFDLVLFGAAAQIRPGTARRVQSRLQSRGAVLVIVGRPGPFSCDVQVTSESAWDGLGDGHGHLHARRVDLAIDGRRIQRTRRGSIWFPDATGEIAPVRPAEAPVDVVVAGLLAADVSAPAVDAAPHDPIPLRRTG